MKAIASSKKVDIRYESELILYFRDLIASDPDLQWHLPPQAPTQDRLPWVELQLDGHSKRFKPFYDLKPSIPELEARIIDWEVSAPRLLVVPELSARLIDFCRQKRLAATDLNGRAYIRLPGVLVDRRSLPGRDFRFSKEPRNVFDGISARIIRTLLTDCSRIWTQKELLPRTHASSGLVSRIVQHLVSQGFLEKASPREFRLRDPLALLDAWAKTDDFSHRTTQSRYTIFGGDALEIARNLQTWAQEESVPIAFTQWIAAWLRHPYTEPVVTSAYVTRLPEAAALEQLGLRHVNDAGKVWLFVPTDEGVFLETQTDRDLPLVTDSQIYLDLLPTGLRGPDAATALRSWEGFCRP